MPPSPTKATNDPNPNLLHSKYGAHPLNAVTLGLGRKHHLHLAASAEWYYDQGCYTHCAAVCIQLLSAPQPPAEAIQARAHWYLAMSGIGAADPWVRVRHAEKAVEMWDVVLDRRGLSRFPIDKAKDERETAEALLVSIREELEEYDELTDARSSSPPAREEGAVECGMDQASHHFEEG